MQEIIRIHIAKTPFEIEVDAKKHLTAYIKGVRAYLKDDELADEIELRIVELLAERGVRANGVVTVKDIDAIKAILGKESDFADSDEQTADTPEKSSEKSPKRLMRDESTGWVAGVLSGVAQYFSAPVIAIRLLAIVLFFVTSGAASIVYLIAWIVLPKVDSKSDKLLLHGQETTVQAMRSLDGERVRQSRSVRFIEVSLRILMATIMAILSIVAMAAIIGVSYTFFQLVDVMDVVSIVLAYGAGLVAGVAAIVFCITCAVLFVRKKRSKTVLPTIVTSFVVGMVFGLTSIGLAMVGTESVGIIEGNTNSVQKQSIKGFAKKMNGAKKVTLHTAMVDEIDYIVTDAAPRIELYESSRLRTLIPHTITRSQDTVTIDVGPTNLLCHKMAFPSKECFTGAKVKIYGPALDVLQYEKGGASLHYHANSQEKLRIQAKEALVAAVHGEYIGTLALQSTPDSKEHYRQLGMGNTSMQRSLTMQLDVKKIGTLDVKNAREVLSIRADDVDFDTIVASTKMCKEQQAVSRSVQYGSVSALIIDDTTVELKDGEYDARVGESAACFQLKKAQ